MPPDCRHAADDSQWLSAACNSGNCSRFRLTLIWRAAYPYPLMFHALTSYADAQRQAAVGRVVADRVLLDRFPRLLDVLASQDGYIEYRVEFDQDPTGRPRLNIHATGEVRLVCQRTLESFVFPIAIDTRLGVIRREEEEAELLADHEPLLLDGNDRSIDSIVEDELVLFLPANPVAPDSESRTPVWQEDSVGSTRTNPFAALGALRKDAGK